MHTFSSVIRSSIVRPILSRFLLLASSDKTRWRTVFHPISTSGWSSLAFWGAKTTTCKTSNLQTRKTVSLFKPLQHCLPCLVCVRRATPQHSTRPRCLVPTQRTFSLIARVSGSPPQLLLRSLACVKRTSLVLLTTITSSPPRGLACVKRTSFLLLNTIAASPSRGLVCLKRGLSSITSTAPPSRSLAYLKRRFPSTTTTAPPSRGLACVKRTFSPKLQGKPVVILLPTGLF